MFKEFKAFISRGNALELAVGIIIGASFTGIVNSLVDDIIMPPLGLLIGNMDFSNLYVNLSNKHYSSLSAAQEAGAATINYGLFINSVINFLIVAFVIFIIIRQVNKMFPSPAKESTSKKCPFCLSSIPKEATKCAQCTSDVSNSFMNK